MYNFGLPLTSLSIGNPWLYEMIRDSKLSTDMFDKDFMCNAFGFFGFVFPQLLLAFSHGLSLALWARFFLVGGSNVMVELVLHLLRKFSSLKIILVWFSRAPSFSWSWHLFLCVKKPRLDILYLCSISLGSYSLNSPGSQHANFQAQGWYDSLIKYECRRETNTYMVYVWTSYIVDVSPALATCS